MFLDVAQLIPFFALFCRVLLNGGRFVPLIDDRSVKKKPAPRDSAGFGASGEKPDALREIYCDLEERAGMLNKFFCG